MRTKYIYMAMMALLLCGCSGKKEQPMEVVVSDSSSVAVDSVATAAMDSTAHQALAAEIQQRVADIYDDVFAHLRADDRTWDGGVRFFSDSLTHLWDGLPDDDLVIDMVPWTYAQDDDSTLAYTKIDVKVISSDSAKANVTMRILKNSPLQTVQLDLVRERKPAEQEPGWYVDDFKHEDYSIAQSIRDYFKEFGQNK